MLELYKRRVGNQGRHVGEALKKQSDTIMEQTFDRDIAYRICYLDGKPIEAKYITYTYYSISKDAVDYHLQFKPGVHTQIGKYIDVPDDTGAYNRWLIVGRSDEPQFVKYNILKCNWTFKWIADGVVHECLGVLRKRNNYNSGLWTDYAVVHCVFWKRHSESLLIAGRSLELIQLQRKDEICLSVNAKNE